ncbi:substrate-binding domain-containing protein [Citrobacter sp. JGM124]|uniref:molybdate ABC transporter substrate-binding protein n=1 Tax=Citrobacter sp. JGM124 TaxID=2799789 RepID=UPI002011531A|nr:substrate-binding domain-containing protein [Citrobacter sp. JGM124]
MMSNSTKLNVHSALVVRSPFDASLLDAYRQDHGSVEATWTPTTVLMKNIESGLACDVVIVTDSAMDKLITDGIVDAATRRPLVISSIGFAVKKGEEHPTITTPDTLRETLLNTRSVCYSIGGASGIHFKNVIRQLGIEEQVDAKACPIPEGFTAEKLITGEASLAVQQISELLVVPGIEIVGSLPEEVQKITSFSIALFRNSPCKAQGQALIDIVTAQTAKAEYERFGLTSRF